MTRSRRRLWSTQGHNEGVEIGDSSNSAAVADINSTPEVLAPGESRYTYSQTLVKAALEMQKIYLRNKLGGEAGQLLGGNSSL